MSFNSPQITKLSWGKIEIGGKQEFKDVKLFPGGCREWNWQETGTEHSPGIQYSDVQELIENGAKVIVLSRGVLGRLKTKKGLVKKLESAGLTIHILKTKEAIKLYNEIYKSELVGALIHTTC
ncbi:MAG: MTH938/NDUFAF3 family protein [Candidatus Marinimicrobia bacterium]|nr:MTH938/NDUFAF3 family protein [Candidatus Neomarinimicrobiota bacterium]